MSDIDFRVLKNVILNKENAIEIVNTVDSKIFSSDIRNFVNAFYLYVNKYHDIPTLRVFQEFVEKHVNDVLAKNIPNIWNEIESVDTDHSELKPDLDKLKNRFAESEIISLQKELNNVKIGNIDVNGVLARLSKTQQSINDLNTDSIFLNEDIDKYLSTFVNNFNYKKNNPDCDKGLLTFYSGIDFATNGLRPADMLLIAGESGHGKSLLLQNIATQIWLQNNNPSNFNFLQGKNIIYFSLEMPYEDCFNRLLAKMAGVPARSLENAKLTKEESIRVKECLDFIKKYPNKFKIVDMVDASANDIESVLIKSNMKYDAVFVDYLGIMKTNENVEDSDWKKQGIISYELRRIARKFKVPVLSAVQLNRKSQKEGGDNIGLSRLARSNEIATHATHVIQIESRQNEHLFPDFIYHFIKNRKGPKLKAVCKKDLKCCNLIDQELSTSDGGFMLHASDISEDLEQYAELNLDL